MTVRQAQVICLTYLLNTVVVSVFVLYSRTGDWITGPLFVILVGVPVGLVQTLLPLLLTEKNRIGILATSFVLSLVVQGFGLYSVLAVRD